MFRWKSCPRCKGDILIDRDEYGWYEQCIICGYMHDLESMVIYRRDNSKHSPEPERNLSRAA